jgi:hypothetical protein
MSAHIMYFLLRKEAPKLDFIKMVPVKGKMFLRTCHCIKMNI